jgi:hypothetical protein
MNTSRHLPAIEQRLQRLGQPVDVDAKIGGAARSICTEICGWVVS